MGLVGCTRVLMIAAADVKGRSRHLHIDFQRFDTCCDIRAQNKAERVSPVDPGTSRGLTYLCASRGYEHPVTRAIKVSHAACKAGFCSKNQFWSISQLKCIFHFLITPMKRKGENAPGLSSA